MNTVIGIDFGTQSARALLVDAADGSPLEAASVRYAQGILPGDLVTIDDYDIALRQLLQTLAKPEYRRTIRGLCIDATSLTLVCLSADGTPLEKLPGFESREQAKAKLWKRHAAEQQAQEALRLAQAMKMPFLRRTGGSISSEWTLPKLLEIRDKDPEVYRQIDLAFDLCEYLTYRLTGQIVRSMGSMCYKALWAQDLGFPSSAYLDALRPGFARKYTHLLRGPVCVPGEKAGFLQAEWCEAFGLSSDVAVAVGLLDGHAAQAALGALHAGDAVLAAGTSNVLSIQTEKLLEIPGICGAAMNGQIPGLCGLDTGQSCTGDMLDWYTKNMLPGGIAQEAARKGIDVHTLLADRVQKPWECPLTITDWWNGSRNAPCDLLLRGFIQGVSMDTRPEDIYLGLLQSIVCGTREIAQVCADSGGRIQRFFAAGGMARKNPLLMQQYADILHMPIQVGDTREGPALGAALFAAAAAGIYPNLREAWQMMGVKAFTVYQPDTEHSLQYEQIYQRNHRIRTVLAAMRKDEANENQ